jgi:hypothetical protein
MPLEACTIVSGKPYGLAMVPVVNLQDGDCHPFLQLGYAIQSGTSVPDFWATTGSTSDDCQLMSPMPYSEIHWAPAAFYGDTVRFEIYHHPVNPTWRLRITNLVTGNTGFRDISDSIGQKWASKVWYGYESHNWGDQLGGDWTNTAVVMKWMGYKYNGGPAETTYLTGTSGTAWANADGHAIPSCWHPSIGTFLIDGINYTKVSAYSDC